MVILLGLTGLIAVGSYEKKVVVDDHGHTHGEGGCAHGAAHSEGPNGGKVLSEGPFELELVIYDKAGSPHFRLYPKFNGKNIDPNDVKAAIYAERLNEKTDTFSCKTGSDFLYSSESVAEPLSFFMKVTAEYKGEEYEWEYSHYDGRITLPDELRRKMNIASEIAGPGKIRSIIRLPGEVVFNGDKLSHIVPRVQGVVIAAKKNLGDKVLKNEPIAVIESRELGEARSKYLVAMEREKLALYNFERSERLHQKESIPEKEYLTSRKAYLEEKIEREASERKLMAMGVSRREILELEDGSYESITEFTIRAPFDGVIVKKHLSPGEWVKEDAEIYLIADLTDVWVDITVYAGDLDSVHIGQMAVVKSAAAGFETLGEVSYVGPIMGEESRTAKARIVIPNTEGKWRPGLFVSIDLIHEQSEARVAIEADAIQTIKNKQVVFIRHNDQYEIQPVELGRKDAHLVEIKKGLNPGDNYVTRNAFVLKAELGKSGMSHQH